ncbi:cytochrome P450 9e2-like [Schistocerca americana]|uniref:cytochrome P450 9e2-like n=1 Tax=Schistocerca americana TaxID=7009 RepID=UPI001F4FFF7A|nr:cytochrome P450 9e2-like [Schistocerca americana]
MVVGLVVVSAALVGYLWCLLLRRLYENTRGLPCAGVFAGPCTAVLLLRDTELVRHVTVRAFADFCDHHAVSGDPLLAGSLMFLRGESWRRMRATLSPAFASGRIKDMMGLMAQVSRNMVDHIDSIIKTSKLTDGPVPMEIEDLMNRYSSDVIASTAFGHDCNSFADRNNEFYRRGKDITDFSGIRALVIIGHVLFPSLMKALGIPFVRASSRDFLLRLVRDAVEARRRSSSSRRPDVLQLLIEARHEDGTALTDIEMAAQVMFFLLAGFDSTTNLLCFTTYLLALHPDVQARLQKELDECRSAATGEISHDDLTRCDYLDWVIAESLRLFPPVPLLDRRCGRACAVGGGPRLRAGDVVAVPVQGLHADPLLFPRPQHFLPERFRRPDQVPQGAYLPFGAGPRACIAKRFALMESKVALSVLLSRYSLHPVEKTPTSIRLTTRGLNMTIDGGFWIGFKPRLSSTKT